jgi:hypothetical protein
VPELEEKQADIQRQNKAANKMGFANTKTRSGRNQAHRSEWHLKWRLRVAAKRGTLFLSVLL